MNQRKKAKQRLLAGLLCAALVMTNVSLTGVQVSANEPETEVVKEAFYEAEESTASVDTAESVDIKELDESEEDADTENPRQEESESLTESEAAGQSETESVIEAEDSTTMVTNEEEEVRESELENDAASQSELKLVEEEELAGVYQFGGAPSRENTGLSAYSVNLASADDAAELEEYIYQQLLARNESINIQSYNIAWDNRSTVGSIVRAVLNEHPELYFVNGSFSYSGTYVGSDIVVSTITMTYKNGLDDSAFKSETKKALAAVQSDMSDLEKAIALHDYLAVNCEYDKENLDANTIPDTSYTAYGVLVNRIAVCEGYALAYKYLLNQVGIDCYMVSSDTMNHAWNLIKLNGNYYQVDVTWDDPTWDLIGRARHQYMFRSDNAFITECNHSNWSVTEGSEIVDYKATDTSYDSAFWVDCNSPLVLVGNDCYYVGYDSEKKSGVINKITLSDMTGTGETICDIDKWTVWGNAFSYYPSAYSGLFQANNRLYYNDKSSIYSIALDDIENDIDKRIEFTADTTNGYIYGSAFCQGKVLYSLHQTPNMTSKETVLTAEITIEIEEPSEVPVEKIELDQEILELVVGDTAVLEAVVTPGDAADVEITWKSNDVSVAEVEDGTVTAIAAGSCTITATAGGKEAVCEVIVTENEEDEEEVIASGSYENITWVIDADGKLIVTGTGDFSKPINVINISRAPWYKYGESITSAEINVEGMTDASYMFFDCKNMTDVDLSSFKTENITRMDGMFRGCENLTNIDVGNFDTKNVIDMKDMFYGCKSLNSLNLSNFNTENVTDMSGMFSGCSSLTNVDVSGFKTQNVTDMRTMFYECRNLTHVKGINFDTRNVTDMGYMFSFCNSLTDLDVSGFNTEKVTDMQAMFQDCRKLTSLDVSDFDTKNVVDMHYMFSNCNGVTDLDVSGFDTSKVTNMQSMFAGCSSVTNIDVSNFDTGNVTNMDGMFRDCSNLTNLDLSKFDTGNVTSMQTMFYKCNRLNILDLSSFNTENVVSLKFMFGYCENLANVDMSNFNTGNVTDIGYLFYGCNNLESVDLSSFDVGNVKDDAEGLQEVFTRCHKLAAIYTPYNLAQSVPLPIVNAEDIWYQPDGTEITALPQNLSYSIKLSKNSVPTISDSYITAQKAKTVYECGDILNLDDLTVTFYDTDGKIKEVTDYTTNADTIDMSTPGTKILIVTYNSLTASVELTVTESAKPDPDKETYTITFDLQGHGTALEEYATYTEIRKGSLIQCPASPEADGYEFTGWYKDAGCQTLWDFEKDTVEENTILYAGWKSSENPEEKPEEKVEEKPLINSVLFPKQKSEYSAVYTGEQIRPVMVVAYQYTDTNGKAKTQKLKLNVDYTVRYSNNINVGENTATVTVRGIGEYTGVITKEFTISQKSIGSVMLSPVGDIVFGEKPSVVVTDGTKELVEDKDYIIQLSAEGSASADTQSVLTVKGIENYTGTSKKSVKFNILKTGTDIHAITDENIHVEFKKLPAKGYTYNGKAQKPGVVVTDTATGKKLPSSMYKVVYSNNINAGKGTAKAWVIGVSKNGKGYYGISEPLSFDINQKDFGKVSASLSGAIPKTGSIETIKEAINEAIIVKDAKHVLSENEYTIDYGYITTVDAIKIGTKYSITLTPSAGGNYVENSQKKVNVKFGQLNLASKTANISVKITDASQNEIEFRYNGILLEKDKDYTATVKKDKNKDTCTVKIKAVKNSAYKGSRTLKNIPFYQDATGDDSEIPVNPNAKPAVSNNKDAQNYRWYDNYNWNWADTVKSYLYENQTGGLTRVEYIDGKIVAEDYDNSFKLCTSRTIPMELSIWGGFYAGDQYNFVIFGQANSSQDDNTEVVRVVKYSKDWQRLGEAKLCGANTVEPFEAGSLRCVEYGDYLYIRTCHKMYASSDGLNHQANMTLAVRQSDMTITDSFYQVMNSSVGYASHSFNQFVLVDRNQNLVTLDHGDAYPRGIVLMRPVNAKAGGDKFSGRFENSELVTFPGTIGDNCTGASIGGFAETENGYVTAFNYDGKGSNGSRAVYLGYTSKSGLDSQTVPITAYDGMRTPVLAPEGLDGGYLMWTDSKNKFYYTRYADGGTIGTISTADASLSDCQPVLHNGEIVWYVTQKSVPTFYKLNVSSSQISKSVAK